jgi:hypothetical protein
MMTSIANALKTARYNVRHARMIIELTSEDVKNKLFLCALPGVVFVSAAAGYYYGGM